MIYGVFKHWQLYGWENTKFCQTHACVSTKYRFFSKVKLALSKTCPGPKHAPAKTCPGQNLPRPILAPAKTCAGKSCADKTCADKTCPGQNLPLQKLGLANLVLIKLALIVSITHVFQNLDLGWSQFKVTSNNDVVWVYSTILSISINWKSNVHQVCIEPNLT